MSRIAEQCIDDRDRVMDALSKIDDAGKQLELLINDVLDMSRLESGRTELTSEPFDIIKVLRSGYDPILVMAQENDVKLTGAHYKAQHGYRQSASSSADLSQYTDKCHQVQQAGRNGRGVDGRDTCRRQAFQLCV